MTENLVNRKYRIIEEIIKIDDESVLSDFESQMSKFLKQSSSSELWSRITTPMRKTITVSELIEEQNYKPIRKDEFFKKTEEIAIEEDIAELLQQIGK